MLFGELVGAIALPLILTFVREKPWPTINHGKNVATSIHQNSRLNIALIQRHIDRASYTASFGGGTNLDASTSGHGEPISSSYFLTGLLMNAQPAKGIVG